MAAYFVVARGRKACPLTPPQHVGARSAFDCSARQGSLCFDRWLRSRTIALESRCPPHSLADEERVRTSARDPGCFFSPYASKQLNPSPAIHSGQQLVDDLFGNPLVVKVGARHVPPSHRTVQSDQPRDTVPPEIPRPKIARVLCRPRVVCSSAVRS
jgi:hypothetical protein